MTSHVSSAGADRASRPLTSRLVGEYIADRRFDLVADGGWHQVRRAIIDTYAVAVAGRAEPVVAAARNLVGATGSGGWMTTARGVTPGDVALVNGTAGHALDFDDVSPLVKGHPSTVLLPALLAAADGDDSLAKIADGYAVGFEIANLFVQALPGSTLFQRGWHATSTIGTMGAAAAVARLWGLDAVQSRHAIGIAGSLASGSRQNFGSMTKPLHAGIAARNGVTAASLAAAGCNADDEMLEGPHGFLALYGGGPPGVEVALPGQGSLLGERGLNIKRYPCCYYTHRAIDAAVELPELLDVDDVQHVEVVVEPAGLSALPHQRPSSGLEGKFSMPYCLAVAFESGVPTVCDFTDDAVRRPAIRRFMELIAARESSAVDPPPDPSDPRYAVVRATLRSGEVAEVRVDVAKGDARSPLTDEQLTAKLLACLEAGAVASPSGIVDELTGLTPDTTVADLCTALGQGTG